MADPRRPLPAWLVGLILAVLIFIVTLLVLNVLGYGDDPVIEGGIVLVIH